MSLCRGRSRAGGGRGWRGARRGKRRRGHVLTGAMLRPPLWAQEGKLTASEGLGDLFKGVNDWDTALEVYRQVGGGWRVVAAGRGHRTVAGCWLQEREVWVCQVLWPLPCSASLVQPSSLAGREQSEPHFLFLSCCCCCPGCRRARPTRWWRRWRPRATLSSWPPSRAPAVRWRCAALACCAAPRCAVPCRCPDLLAACAGAGGGMAII